MVEIDKYKDGDVVIFIYLIGHGYNDGHHSNILLKPNSNAISSLEFRNKIDNLESAGICVFTESCYSGDFVDDLGEVPYLSMSTSDEYHPAYPIGFLPNEGRMSYMFFNYIKAGYNAIESFKYAKQYVPFQYPKIQDCSAYEFFVD